MLATLRREPLYFGDAGAGLFGFLHIDDAAAARNCVAVVCPPLGYEYAHSHRSVRHLADALARSGIPALRFDYHGTGDSAGSDLDADRLQRWLRDVKLAVAEAGRLSGGAAVCLLGIRMGATLAALAAAEADVNADWLVLWNACTSGRRYLREQQAVAAQATQAASGRAPGAPLEVAGFLLSAQTQDSLKAIDLLDTASRARRGALLIERDDLGEDTALRDHLIAQGVATVAIACPGFSDMMAEPVRTQVPQVAIDATVNWLVARSDLRADEPSALAQPEDRPERQLCRQPPSAAEMRFDFTATDGARAELVDTVYRFGAEGHLFGIHTQPAIPNAELPALVLFSAGVVHRMGPNRLYTLLARNLSALGFTCFRCDLQGIGDSKLPTPGRENHPYPETALADAEAAFDALHQRSGAQRFVAIGLCSGAYTSFLAGAESVHTVCETVLINPLTFEWKEGDTLDTDHFREVAHYRGSLRSGSSWKKLLCGKVDVLKVAKLLWAHGVRQVRSRLGALVERLDRQAGSLPARRLRKALAKGRHVALFVAEGEPGWDMLVASARQAVGEGVKRGALSVQVIAEADHTFSSEAARLRLLHRLREDLRQRYPHAS